MHKDSLPDRENTVLNIIIEDYITTAAPVGSRTVSKKSALRLSPASMRNLMADLTERGFLTQPHTSAGRIPTPAAFRHYLDTTLKIRRLSGRERRKVADRLAATGLDLPAMLTEASKLLSSSSRQLSIILSPSREDARWREIDFTQVKPGLVLTVLVLDGGIVQNKLLEVDPTWSKDDLTTFGNFLNAHYKGLTLAEARLRILEELKATQDRLQDIYARALFLAQSATSISTERDIFVDGASSLLDQAEFSDPSRVKELLRLLEERTKLLSLLDKTIAKEGVKITVGDEETLEGFGEYSVVSSPFGGSESRLGAVNVIGPMRMDYAAVIPLVECIADALTTQLSDRF